MIVSRTPFRISFFGGGTDDPACDQEHGGAVVATTIDKYCSLTCRVLPPFCEHCVRIVVRPVTLGSERLAALADRIHACRFQLPNHPRLTAADIERICVRGLH